MFELTVHDVTESYDDDLPPSLVSLREWLEAARRGAAPFELNPYWCVGMWIGEGADALVEPSCGTLESMAGGCRAAADLLAAGRVGLVRSLTDNSGWYIVFSSGDPVRVVVVGEGLPDERPFLYSPSVGHDTPEAIARFLTWAEGQAESWLAPTGNKAHDRSMGRNVRLDRAQLIADLRREAALADEVLAFGAG